MTERSDKLYRVLADALPEHNPRVVSIDGTVRVLLTIAPNETLEVQAVSGEAPLYRMSTVVMLPCGSAVDYFVAICQGDLVAVAIASAYLELCKETAK